VQYVGSQSTLPWAVHGKCKDIDTTEWDTLAIRRMATLLATTEINYTSEYLIPEARNRNAREHSFSNNLSSTDSQT